MGACFSCLGLAERPVDEEPSESERLLYDETGSGRLGYGTTGLQVDTTAPDPEEVRRHQEMLERICAETANNLIDVQHTNLLTLRGKPSAEFAALLNTHFEAAQGPASPDVTAVPTTPNPNKSFDDAPEPPSPFTQAQLQAARQNGRDGVLSPYSISDGRADLASSYHSAPQTPPRNVVTDQEPDRDKATDEQADEEAWLKTITNSEGNMNWDEIKQPQADLVLQFNGDFPAMPGPK